MSIIAVSSEDDSTAAAAFASVLPCCRLVWLLTTSVLPLGSDETSKSEWATLHPAPAVPETLFLCVVELQWCVRKRVCCCSGRLSPNTFRCTLLWTQLKKSRHKLYPSHHFDRKHICFCYLNHSIVMRLNEISNRTIYLYIMHLTETFLIAEVSIYWLFWGLF